MPTGSGSQRTERMGFNWRSHRSIRHVTVIPYYHMAVCCHRLAMASETRGPRYGKVFSKQWDPFGFVDWRPDSIDSAPTTACQPSTKRGTPSPGGWEAGLNVNAIPKLTTVRNTPPYAWG